MRLATSWRYPLTWRHATAIPLASRAYSAKVSGDHERVVKTLADVKEYLTTSNVPDIEVSGWVRSVRKSAGVRFVDITDGSSMRPVQAVIDKKLSSEYDLICNLTANALRADWNLVFVPALRYACAESGNTVVMVSKPPLMFQTALVMTRHRPL